MDALAQKNLILAKAIRYSIFAIAAWLVPQVSQAVHLPGAAPLVLLVNQATETDSSGAIVKDARVARLAAPGSTRLGLTDAWSEAFVRLLPTTDLAVAALPWRDPSVLLSGTFALGRISAASGLPARGTLSTVPSAPGVLERATTHFAAQASALAAGIRAVLATEGVQEAWFSYRQQLSYGGQMQRIAWSMHVAANGTWFSTAPAYDLDAGRVLRVRYTSLHVAQGLPATLAYRDGGWLVWQVVGAAGVSTELGGARDTHGAFDSLVGLGCLLGVTHTNCAIQQPGLNTLADEVGATQIELDYVEALTPDYVEGANASRIAPAILEVTRALESVDPHCRSVPLRYVNVFQASFRLQARVDHFARSPPAAWVRTVKTQILQTGMQPWRTVSLDLTASEIPGLSDYIVDPDTGHLNAISAYPAGIQDIQAGPVVCRTPYGLP